MKHFVYKIVNLKNEVEYIGETKNIEKRFRNHICKNGKFYNRKDISIEIIKECSSKNVALNLQYKLQLKNGFETDRDKTSKNMKKVQQQTTQNKSIPLLCFDLNGNFIGEYKSAYDANRKLNINTYLIWRVVNGIQKSTKNLIFTTKY